MPSCSLSPHNHPIHSHCLGLVVMMSPPKTTGWLRPRHGSSSSLTLSTNTALPKAPPKCPKETSTATVRFLAMPQSAGSCWQNQDALIACTLLPWSCWGTNSSKQTEQAWQILGCLFLESKSLADEFQWLVSAKSHVSQNNEALESKKYLTLLWATDVRRHNHQGTRSLRHEVLRAQAPTWLQCWETLQYRNLQSQSCKSSSISNYVC